VQRWGLKALDQCHAAEMTRNCVADGVGCWFSTRVQLSRGLKNREGEEASDNLVHNLRLYLCIGSRVMYHGGVECAGYGGESGEWRQKWGRRVVGWEWGVAVRVK
jgi:hypothetical protein